MKRLPGFLRSPALQPTLLALAIGLGSASPARAASYYEDALQRFEAKDYSGAIIQLKNALRNEPNKLAIQFLLGRALQQNGDVVAAEVAYIEAIRLGISRSEVAVPLAQVMVAQGRQREMLAHPQLQPSGLPTDRQVKRCSYTANDMIFPRNKFSQGSARRNQLVIDARITLPVSSAP